LPEIAEQRAEIVHGPPAARAKLWTALHGQFVRDRLISGRKPCPASGRSVPGEKREGKEKQMRLKTRIAAPALAALALTLTGTTAASAATSPVRASVVHPDGWVYVGTYTSLAACEREGAVLVAEGSLSFECNGFVGGSYVYWSLNVYV
jgi:hypothetical protein